MASIDKIYGTKEQHDLFYKWCEENYPKALKYFYDWDLEWNNNLEHPITNFPTKIDIWMYKNCPLEFVVETIKEQYGGSPKENLNYNFIFPWYSSAREPNLYFWFEINILGYTLLGLNFGYRYFCFSLLGFYISLWKD